MALVKFTASATRGISLTNWPKKEGGEKDKLYPLNWPIAIQSRSSNTHETSSLMTRLWYPLAKFCESCVYKVIESHKRRPEIGYKTQKFTKLAKG